MGRHGTAGGGRGSTHDARPGPVRGADVDQADDRARDAMAGPGAGEGSPAMADPFSRPPRTTGPEPARPRRALRATPPEAVPARGPAFSGGGPTPAGATAWRPPSGLRRHHHHGGGQEGTRVDTRPDTARPDTTRPDAAQLDAAQLDAGPTDADQLDGPVGPPDIGPPDIGPADIGPPDIGPPDIGPPDIGPSGDGPEDHGSHRHRPRARVPVLAGMVAVGLLAVAGAAGRSWVDESQPAAQASCLPEATTTVVVAADPTIAPAILDATKNLGRRPLELGGCVTVSVVAKDPLQTASDLSTLPGDRLPDLWVPDSTTWLDRVAARPVGDEVPLADIGSLASSPLIFAVDPASAGQLGWTSAPPTWRDVLTSGRPVALPDLTGSAVGFSALSALRSSVRTAAGPDAAGADLRTVLTTVAGAIDEGQVTTVAEGFDRAEAGGPASPIVPTSEQQWFLRTRDQTTPDTVMIRPRDGQVLLDYPLVRVDRAAVGQNQAAVEGIIRVLESDGRDAARTLGFNPGIDSPRLDMGAAGVGPTPAASPPAAVAPVVVEAAPSAVAPVDLGPVLPPPSQEEVEVLLRDLADLTRPARVLMVVDASVSMRAMAGDGTRATLARDATKSSLALFSDSATVGLWFFAIGMGSGSADHTEIVPLRAMTSDAGGVSQREALQAGADTLTERLTMGGTGLNDTVLAAVRAVQASYVPDTTNSVVLLTDGRNDDPNGIDIDELTATLAAEADPERPVRLAMVGIGEDADAADLRRIAEATGGRSYVTDRPEDFQSVLFDALRRPS